MREQKCSLFLFEKIEKYMIKVLQCDNRCDNITSTGTHEGRTDMMTLKQERELVEKGYKFYKTFDSQSEAKRCAEQLRAEGNFARVGECSTNVIGLHDFVVWYKRR